MSKEKEFVYIRINFDSYKHKINRIWSIGNIFKAVLSSLTSKTVGYIRESYPFVMFSHTCRGSSFSLV